MSSDKSLRVLSGRAGESFTDIILEEISALCFDLSCERRVSCTFPQIVCNTNSNVNRIKVNCDNLMFATTNDVSGATIVIASRFYTIK